MIQPDRAKSPFCAAPCRHFYLHLANPALWLNGLPFCRQLQRGQIDTLDDPQLEADYYDKNFRFAEQGQGRLRFPKESENALVVVETRKHPRLANALQSVATFAPEWQLYVIHGSENKAFVEGLLGDARSNVTLAELPGPLQSSGDYNRLLKSGVFWSRFVRHNRVLIFQSDTLLCKPGIHRFLHFDYVGAPWPWWIRTYGTERVGGNGGLSLRNPRLMLEIAERFSAQDTIPLCFDYHNEDVFFSYHLYEIGAKLPSWNDAMFFSSEQINCPRSIGIHQIWRFRRA